MARTRLVVVGLMAFALLSVSALAKSDSKNSKHDSADDNGGNDEQTLSHKEEKDCYNANPGCQGDCVWADNDNGWECVVPDGSDDQFELCGPGKHGKGEWAIWEGGDAACTCAAGFVTSTKVVEHADKTGKMPPASKLCTVECADVECLDGDGPLDCTCLDNNDDDKKASHDEKKAEHDSAKEDKNKKDGEGKKAAAKPAAAPAKPAAAPAAAAKPSA